jgi:hypothetical protein
MPRIRQLLVAPELVACIATGTFRVVSNEMPSGAQLIGAGYDADKRFFFMTMKHDSFDEVSLGQAIPIHPSPMIERISHD